MKATFVSSYAVSQALRLSVLKAQSELTKATREATTSRVADIGLALGSRTNRSVSFARDLARLQGIVDTNSLARSRLSTTQTALNQIGTSARELLSTLTASVSGNAVADVTVASASDTLRTLTTVLNMSYNGEHIFAGINTDIEPINDFEAAGSASRAAFDTAFLTYFGFTQSDPAAASITGTQMDGFLSTVETQFLGTGWQGTWSNATDEGITSRISLSESIQTSVSANEPAMRKLAMAAATIVATFDTNIGDDARKSILDRSFALVGEALNDLANLEAKTGIVENRIKNATERISMQSDILELSIADLEGVDPYEASVRVAALQQQTETAYLLTAQLQQMTLLNFLK